MCTWQKVVGGGGDRSSDLNGPVRLRNMRILS